MDNRDNMEKMMNDVTEKTIKANYEQIPESLSPENIEQKLASMTQGEYQSRMNSRDIPAPEEMAKVQEKKMKSGSTGGKGLKIVLPVILAAVFVFALGAGIILAINKSRERTGDVSTTSDVDTSSKSGKDDKTDSDKDKDPDENTDKDSDKSGDKDDDKESEDEDSYKQAFDLLNNISKRYDEYYYTDDDVVYEVEEAADEDAFSGDSTATYKADSTYSSTEASSTLTTGNSDEVNFTDTNVRTEGVSEGDIIKTDGKYIYDYDSYTEHLEIYSVDDGQIEKLSRVNVLMDDAYGSKMYIYNDSLVFIAQGYGEDWYDSSVYVVVYDISDRENPEYKDTFKQQGNLNTTRMVDGILYTFSNKYFDVYALDKKDYGTYIPTVSDDFIPASNLIVNKDCYTENCMVMTSIDIEKGEFIDEMAMFGGSSTFYMSTESIYFADRYYSWYDYSYSDDSKLTKISYKDGEFEYQCTGDFPGYLNDDYSIDEYNGYLRLVTTYYGSDWTRKNGLYVYDENLETVSRVLSLAENEEIKSARFMGDIAYFVTFRNTDPLFAVDLSDPEKPEILDYLKIPGFSAYLHPYGDDKLLGIGYDADESTGWTSCIKLTMFDISDPTDIVEEDTLIMDNFDGASVLDNRNAFMFNNEDGTFGFAADYYNYDYDWGWEEEDIDEEDEEDVEDSDEDVEVEEIEEEDEYEYVDGVYYMVFDYDEEEGFVEKLDYQLSDMYYDMSLYNTRGIVIGDYLYVVVSGEKIVSFDTESYEQVDECD